MRITESQLRSIVRREMLGSNVPTGVVGLVVREMVSSAPDSDALAEAAYWSRVSRKWEVVEESFSRPNRRQRRLAERRLLREAGGGLLAKAWGGLKGLAVAAGAKVIDAASWAAKKAAAIGGKAGALLKKVGGKLQEIVVFAIKRLPGGDAVLEFLETVAGKLKEKFAEMRAAIGKKVEEWVKGAKKGLVDLFFKYVLTDEEMKAHFYKAMGITEDELESIKKEGRRRGFATITELNARLARRPLLSEAEEEEGSLVGNVADKIKEKTGIKDATEVAMALGAIENTGPDKVNPEEVLRGKAAKVIEKLIDFWGKLVEQDPKKYHKAFYDSGYFNLFGETGFGLASASFMGILAASELKWPDLVRFVKSVVRGFEGGTARPPGSTSNRAGAFLFLGNKGNKYDASLFKNFVTGIIKGSNIEVLVRALAGDATKIPEIAKRVVGTIVNGVREAVKKQGISAEVAQAAGEEGGVADDTEEQVNDAVGGYIDEMFGSAA